MAKVFHLDADYRAPYKEWAPCMLRKDDFLRDARRLVRQVARYLPEGFTLLHATTCRGGPAVGGDVYAYYEYAEGKAVCLCVGQSALKQGRADGIACHANTCRYWEGKRGIRTRALGVNVWISADLDARELAQAVMDVARRQYRVTSDVVSRGGQPDLTFAFGVHDATPGRGQQLALW